jgi:hypothetical protein
MPHTPGTSSTTTWFRGTPPGGPRGGLALLGSPGGRVGTLRPDGSFCLAPLPLRAPAQAGTLTRGTLSRGPRWHPSPPTWGSSLSASDLQEPPPVRSGCLPSWTTSNRGNPHPWHSWVPRPQPHPPTPGIRSRVFAGILAPERTAGARFLSTTTIRVPSEPAFPWRVDPEAPPRKPPL